MTSNRWVHLATAPDQMTAELWVSILRDAGVSAMVNPADAVSFLGVAGFGCRVQVTEDDLAIARDILGDEALDEDAPR